MRPELGHRGEDGAPNPKRISGECDAGQLRGRRQTKDVVSDRGGEGDRQKTWALLRPGYVCGVCVCVCVRACLCVRSMRALTCSSALQGSPFVSRSLVRSRFWGKYNEWQTFSARRFLMENLMRWMVSVWGRWVSVKTWKKHSHRGDESQALETGQFQGAPGPTGCSSSPKRREWNSTPPRNLLGLPQKA